MNVAFFASSFHPHLGGVEEHVRQLAHAYRGKSVSPIVLTNCWPRSLPAYEEYEGIPVYRLAMRVPEGGMKAQLSYRMTHGALCKEMLGILQKHNIDLLHVHCVSSNGYYALLAREATGLPLVVTTHGERTMDATGLYQRSTFMNQVLRELLTEAEYITACSHDTLNDMELYFGQQFGNRASVIYNGVQLGDFESGNAFSHPKPYILGMGRLVPQKGFDVLIEAYAQAKLSSHDLLIAGEGPEREALEKLSLGRGLHDRVHFLGRAERATVTALFRGCSFFVLPSRQEPMGIVNLEAMAAGKAVIASRVGGVPEIVPDGETGLLVPAGDANALSTTLVQLAADAELRQRLGSAGRRHVTGFTWPAVADQYLRVYRSLGTGDIRSREMPRGVPCTT